MAFACVTWLLRAALARGGRLRRRGAVVRDASALCRYAAPAAEPPQS